MTPTPDAETPLPEELVVIEHFSYVHEAYMARTRLESAGIPCYVGHENTALLTVGTLPPGGIPLLVRAIDAEAAAALVRGEPLTADDGVGEDDETDPPVCLTGCLPGLCLAAVGLWRHG